MAYFKHDNALVSDGATVGEGTRVWAFANIMPGATVGAHCNICDGCFIEKGAVVGNHVTLKNHVALWDGVTLEDDVFVGAHAIFINDRLPRGNRQDAWTLERTLVKKGATIGAGAVVMCSVTIEQYAFVAAGAVVTKNVEPFALVVGNPARFKGYVCVCARALPENLACSCGRAFKKINGQLSLSSDIN